MINSKIFNEAREAYPNQVLKSKELKILLANMTYGKSDVLIPALANHKCLIRVSKGNYQFPDHPVHHSLIDKAIEQVRTSFNSYSKKSKNEKKDSRTDIQKAIELLLSTGEYEIYKVEKIVNIKKTQINI